VGIYGLTVAMFLPEMLFLNLCLTVQHYERKSVRKLKESSLSEKEQLFQPLHDLTVIYQILSLKQIY
jgi:hypothetical protein